MLLAKSGWPKELGCTSQDGSGNQFRSMTLRGEKMTYSEEFVRRKLADVATGIVQFDFVSIAKIPRSEPAITNEQFQMLVSTVTKLKVVWACFVLLFLNKSPTRFVFLYL